MSKLVKLLFLHVSAILVSFNSLAFEFNLEVDINTKTDYRQCQEYADDIVDLVRLFIKTDNSDMRCFIEQQISFLKKQLKSCEKMNKKGSRKNADVKFGVGHSFNS